MSLAFSVLLFERFSCNPPPSLLLVGVVQYFSHQPNRPTLIRFLFLTHLLYLLHQILLQENETKTKTMRQQQQHHMWKKDAMYALSFYFPFDGETWRHLVISLNANIFRTSILCPHESLACNKQIIKFDMPSTTISKQERLKGKTTTEPPPPLANAYTKFIWNSNNICSVCGTKSLASQFHLTCILFWLRFESIKTTRLQPIGRTILDSTPMCSDFNVWPGKIINTTKSRM